MNIEPGLFPDDAMGNMPDLRQAMQGGKPS